MKLDLYSMKKLTIGHPIFGTFEEKGMIISNNQQFVTIINILGQEKNYSIDHILTSHGFNVNAVEKEIFTKLKAEQKEIAKLQSKVADLQLKIQTIREEQFCTMEQLKEASPYLSKEVFVSAVNKQLETCLDGFKISSTPGCGYSYAPTERVVYIYNDVEIQKYARNSYPELIMTEFDGVASMVPESEKTATYKTLIKRYEKKLLSNVRSTSFLYLGDKDTLYFKQVYKLPIKDEFLKENVVVVANKIKAML